MTTRAEKIDIIRKFPERLAARVAGLSAEQLTTPYDRGEWTIAQNVHHMVDSHGNSYIRFKRIATEDNPHLAGYDQVAWAKLPDDTGPDLEASLTILRGLHARWCAFLENLPEDAWSRSGYHSENGTVTLDSLLTTYANHCDGHLAQIQRVLDKMPQ